MLSNVEIGKMVFYRRYKQFLDPLMQAEWTEEEEKYLYSLHNQIGNKWALIATYFVGR